MVNWIGYSSEIVKGDYRLDNSTNHEKLEQVGVEISFYYLSVIIWSHESDIKISILINKAMKMNVKTRWNLMIKNN